MINKSVITDNLQECIVCGSKKQIEFHHVFFGSAKRKLSDKYKIIAPLCNYHHRGTNGIHGKNGKVLDTKLKQHAQRRAMEYYDWDIDDFRRIFGKNYL